VGPGVGFDVFGIPVGPHHRGFKSRTNKPVASLYTYFAGPVTLLNLRDLNICITTSGTAKH